MEIAKTQPREIITQGKKALTELKALVTNRKDKLVINGRQYLYFSDWQTLGAFCNITAKVVDTKEITREVPSETGKLTFNETIGFYARAEAIDQTGRVVSAADAECLFEEQNWQKKPRFQVRSMAQTRACAKCLRNCLSWIVKLPDSNFSDEVAEEIPQEDY